MLQKPKKPTGVAPIVTVTWANLWHVTVTVTVTIYARTPSVTSQYKKTHSSQAQASSGVSKHARCVRFVLLLGQYQEDVLQVKSQNGVTRVQAGPEPSVWEHG